MSARHDKLRDPTLVAARDGHYARLARLGTGALPDRPLYLNGCHGHGSVDPYREPEAWVASALDGLAERAEQARDEVVFRPLCVEFGPFGVHFSDRLLGAHVHFHAGQWWSELLTTPVGSLRRPDLDRDETWALARRLAEAFVAHETTLPVFGAATIASALNVAVNLYGEAFLLALLAQPDAARRDLATINDLLCTLHRWYRARVPASQLQCVVAGHRTQPPGCGQLCGCTTQLLSRAAYAEFVAPLDDALLSVYPGGGLIHLCGAHLQHLPTWRAMRSLRAVQLNDRAAEDFEAYFTGLRDDQVIYLNPTDTLTAARALELTGGRRLVLVSEP